MARAKKPTPVPRRLEPREDQAWKIERVLNEPTQAALIADDMGKGKTLMGTEIVLRSDWKRTLIVGIRDTGKQWAESFFNQSGGAVEVKLMNSKTVDGEKNWDDFMAGKPGVYFAGIQWLVSKDWEVVTELDEHDQPIKVQDKKTGEWKDKTFSQHTEFIGRRLNTKGRHIDAVIFDEVHKMQNRKSQTSRTIYSIKSDWRIGLSGTFAGNSFTGAWRVCKWLWPKLIDGSFVRWKGVWCKTEPITRKDGSIIKSDNPYADNEKVVGEKQEGAFVKTLPCYIRDEPDPVPAPRILTVQLTERQREQYESLQETSMAWLDAHTPFGKEPLIADLPITQRQRLRTATLGEMRFLEDGRIGFDPMCESAKLNVTKHIVDNIWANMPIVIGAVSIEFVMMAAERFRKFGYGAVEWHGKKSSNERAKVKEAFIARDPAARYLFCTIPSIGTGTDGLQRACSKMIWLEESENNLENAQFVKRCARPGMTLDYGPFEHVKLLADGTIDFGIMYRHDANQASINASMRRAA
ncbi:SNF2-related protein [Leifsonia aquatica]|uniref:SNF2-related protein n=1 Tax=Leifsonia aquatica TaxID=144185 RepID=UPI00046A1143|nr:SNF2-related protein [Leifsonia aquatica]